jgi:hypothetical protein
MPSVVLKLRRALSDTGVEEHTPQSAGPLLRGTGDTDYLCGNCGFVIASGIGPRQRVGDRAEAARRGGHSDLLGLRRRKRIPT